MSNTSTVTSEAAIPMPQSQARVQHGPVIVAAGEGDLRSLFEAAQLVAARLGTGVRVVSVVPPILAPAVVGTAAFVPPTDDTEQELRDDVAQLLERQIREAGGGLSLWEWEVLSGDPPSTIVRRATELDAALVIMGIGRHRPIDRLLAAETTLRVVRHTTAPVLAVGPTFDALPSVVVVATDFGPRSAIAAESALPLLADGATLHLVHVWEPSGSTNAAILAMEQRYHASLPTRFERFKTALALPTGLRVATHALEGKIADRLLDLAESVHADLMVAGRQGLNLVARLVVGSVTTALVRGATCAVMIAPEPLSAELDRVQRALTGTSEHHDPAHWQSELEAFTRRNTGRRADLEVDDPDIGAQTQERGYDFVGADYDPHHARLGLMLGVAGGTSHLGRGITNADSLAIVCDEQGRDLALCIRHGRGQTLLLFGPTT
jgi:nucleotide-binding universal stress UspA family protein